MSKLTTRPHTIKFDDADWETIKRAANRLHMTPSAFVHAACAQMLAQVGEPWVGTVRQGRPRKDESDLDLVYSRMDAAWRGIPLADDD